MRRTCGAGTCRAPGRTGTSLRWHRRQTVSFGWGPRAITCAPPYAPPGRQGAPRESVDAATGALETSTDERHKRTDGNAKDGDEHERPHNPGETVQNGAFIIRVLLELEPPPLLPGREDAEPGAQHVQDRAHEPCDRCEHVVAGSPRVHDRPTDGWPSVIPISGPGPSSSARARSVTCRQGCPSRGSTG